MFIEARGYACRGDFDRALELAEQSFAIDRPRERLVQYAIMLYNAGRKQEALQQLDELINSRPNYGGGRYDIRALIYYEEGRTELALAELQAGASRAWGQMGDVRSLLGGEHD